MDAEENIQNLLEDLLPKGSAFILVVTKSGEPSQPAFVHNLQKGTDVIEIFRQIVEGFDFEAAIAKN